MCILPYQDLPRAFLLTACLMSKPESMYSYSGHHLVRSELTKSPPEGLSIRQENGRWPNINIFFEISVTAKVEKHLQFNHKLQESNRKEALKFKGEEQDDEPYIGGIFYLCAPEWKLADSQLISVHFLTEENPISFYEITHKYMIGPQANIYLHQYTLLYCNGAEPCLSNSCKSPRRTREPRDP